MKSAVIWLTDKEQDRYCSGERVFICGRRRVVLAWKRLALSPL